MHDIEIEPGPFLVDPDKAAAWIEEEFKKKGVDIPRRVIRLILDMEHKYLEQVGIAAKYRDGGLPYIISFNMN